MVEGRIELRVPQRFVGNILFNEKTLIISGLPRLLGDRGQLTVITSGLCCLVRDGVIFNELEIIDNLSNQTAILLPPFSFFLTYTICEYKLCNT